MFVSRCILKTLRIRSSLLRRFLCAERKGSEMVRVLSVAEKNDAAKNIAELMSKGRMRRRDGLSVYNKIYEYEYTVFNRRCEIVMTSVSGHLLNLEFGLAFKRWNAVDPASLFEAPVMPYCPDNYKSIKDTLEREVRNCEHLIIWTDCDREGENIGFEIIEVCQKVKPRITIHRARFSEITVQAVTRAINNLAAPDERVNNAVNVRKELDLRIGAAFTRFQTLRLRRVFPDVLSNQLISYGSCQFPTLGFVVERYKQVQAFVPEEFWKLKVVHKKDDFVTEFTWKRGRLFDHTSCLVLYKVCLERPTATVTDINSRPKSKWRPLPLDTVELEKTASRKLHIGAKEALNIAEKLYTKGFISYPRTETTIFPKEIDLVNLVQMQTNDANWGEFANRVLESGPNPRQGTKTDNAHPPIHPIKYTSTLEGNERKIYEFVVRRFLACLSKDAEGLETTINIDVADEKFAVSGLMIIERNFLDVYPYEKWNAKEVAEYRNGETFCPTAIEMNEGKTNAPELLTEADLISLMEKHGIGTDATHSEHIETIKSRLYVGVNENRRFVPGELGMGLVEGYDLMGFDMSKPNLRAELEADLKRICDGQKNPNVVLQTQIEKYKQYFVEAVRQATKIDTALSNYFQLAPGQVHEETYEPQRHIMKCPKCSSANIIIRKKKDNSGFLLSCMAFPQCTAVMWFPDSVENLDAADDLCTECQPGPIRKLKFKVKRGSLMPFYDDEFVSCVGGCDENLMRSLNLRPISSTVQSTLPTSNVISVRNQRNSDGGYASNRSTDAPPVPTFARSHTIDSSFPPYNDRLSNGARSGSSHLQNGDRSFPKKSTKAQTPSNSFDSGVGVVVCSCNQPAILLTVRKEGPNTGRKFYKCSGSENTCNFFLWDDSETQNSSSDYQTQSSRNTIPSVASSSSNSNRRLTLDSDTSDVYCTCGKQAKLRTVTKEGPNTGRQFYSCPLFGQESCNFFKWHDESGSSDQARLLASLGTKNAQSKRGSDSDSALAPKRKCGLCSEPGHTRKTCPMKSHPV